MSFEAIMNKLRGSYSTRVADNPAVTQWKAQGKPVVGYMCNNFPEEILAAAGIFPVRFLGAPIDIVEANQYHSIFMCHFGRSILELGLTGDYRALNGLVSAYGCEGGCNLFQVLMEMVPLGYEDFLHVPHNSDAVGAHEFYYLEMQYFRRSLEKSFNCTITDDDLARAIAIYNQQRRLLREIFELRGKGDRPLIKGTEVAEILEYVASVPKEQGNELLEELIAEAQKREDTEPVRGPRLLVEGTVLPDRELYRLVEDLGGMVVGDDLCTGTRYFWEPVDQQLPPLEALSRYILDRIPCPCMSSEKVAERRIEHLLQQAKEYKASGVIFAVQKWCDSMQMDRPFVTQKLLDAGLGVLNVEVERTTGVSQFLTRLEAFMEMLSAKGQVEVV